MLTRKQIAIGAGLAIAGGLAGGAIVERFRAPRIVTTTEYRDRVVEHTVTVEKPVVVYRDRILTRTVTKPDGTKVETRIDDKSSKTKGEVTRTEDATIVAAGKSSVVTAPEGRWSVRVLAGLDTGGSVLAGAGVDYRLVGPFTLGAWVQAPVAGGPGRFAGGLSVGLRLP